ncbi:transposase-like protein [Salinibacter ruber]|jgi:transposase-like protein|uniref:Transposase-like protein n=1 Tax=Salinibacter ruber TaxID=146919 RepID=A0A9X2U0Q4_9BACT|nr:IS1595 family transposase [Salinibacter ruber]MCS3632709.1 transposase-like protein [Salinibacter ruber]MCS3857533.1 transposase-like protein [Salinibacter ruber]MCS3864358.1 transposase-like protein [Salinibacter ruber]MCS4150466.1 transposase-like protein [Salinibacter ruber]MCS4177222.1 transposase-like protein [Salinibacter ruber]
MALSEESFLPDAEDCAETWRALRWPDGAECVECGSGDVAVQDWDYLSSLRRYQCRECGRWFNDRSGTFIESSKVRLPVWIYVLREMDKDRSINSIAKDLPHTYKTVHRIATTMREAIYRRREEWREVLTGEVEADDVHLTLGQQGRTLGSEEASEEVDEGSDEGDRSTEAGSTSSSEQCSSRKPRERGLSKRGRGSWSGDQPPAVLWVERNGPGRRLELQPDVTQRTLLSSAVRHVEPGSEVDTDDFSGYRLLGEVYDHRSVDHEETYVTDEGTHCNTAEGEWSIFKPWWHGFRGVAKRHAYRYLSEYSFRRSHRSDSRQKRLRRMIALLRLNYGPSNQARTSFGVH